MLLYEILLYMMVAVITFFYFWLCWKFGAKLMKEYNRLRIVLIEKKLIADCAQHPELKKQ
jgi:hypothetical protein